MPLSLSLSHTQQRQTGREEKKRRRWWVGKRDTTTATRYDGDDDDEPKADLSFFLLRRPERKLGGLVGGLVGVLRKEVPTRAQERETPTSTVCACATAAALYAGERCWGQAMLLYMAELGGERERERYFSSWPPHPCS